MNQKAESNRLTDLVQRLRGVNWVCHTYGKTEVLHDTVCHEAADALEAQAKRIAELEAALKPFDEMLQRDFSVMADDKRYDDDFTAKVLMRLGDLRTARKVLGEKE